MSITVTRITIVRVHDELDATGLVQLERILLDLVDHQGIKDLLVDLTEAGSIDDRLESILAQIRARIDRIGGSLELRTKVPTTVSAVAVAERIPTFVPIEPADHQR